MKSVLPTGFVPFFRNKFPGLFQDFSRTQIDFSRALKFTLTSTIPRSQWQFSLLPSIHFIFLAAFHRFPGLSRTSGLFPGLSSPGKCHNEIPGLSRFSRTRTNPVPINITQSARDCLIHLLALTIIQPMLRILKSAMNFMVQVPQSFYTWLPKNRLKDNNLKAWNSDKIIYLTLIRSEA